MYFMDIPKVKLIPQVVNSLIIVKTDLPVPSNFTQVINYYGDEEWLGLWVDCVKRLTVYDGKRIRTSLQLGWNSYLQYPQIKTKISWLKQQNYSLIPQKNSLSHQESFPSHGILYQRKEQILYLCFLPELYRFLKRQINEQKADSNLNINNREQEARWVEDFNKLAQQQKFLLQNYQIYYKKAVKEMGKWLDAYFSSLPESDLESIA